MTKLESPPLTQIPHMNTWSGRPGRAAAVFLASASLEQWSQDVAQRPSWESESGWCKPQSCYRNFPRAEPAVMSWPTKSFHPPAVIKTPCPPQSNFLPPHCCSSTTCSRYLQTQGNLKPALSLQWLTMLSNLNAEHTISLVKDQICRNTTDTDQQLYTTHFTNSVMILDCSTDYPLLMQILGLM